MYLSSFSILVLSAFSVFDALERLDPYVVYFSLTDPIVFDDSSMTAVVDLNRWSSVSISLRALRSWLLRPDSVLLTFSSVDALASDPNKSLRKSALDGLFISDGRKYFPFRFMGKSPKSSPNKEKLHIKSSDKDLVCGACLLDLFTDDSDFLAVPVGCPHLFHWDCLTNWAKLQNTCPQCKNRFRLAGKYDSTSQSLIECVKFHKRDRVGEAVDNDGDDEEAPVDLCEKCKEPGTDEDLILCDGMDFTCNAMFHYRCMGFNSVPRGLWFCESCIEKGYIPESMKQSSPASPASPPKKKKPRQISPPSESVSPARVPVPHIMPPPNIMPRTLVVQEGANRRNTSSGLPRNLLLPNFSLPPPVSRPDTTSVFARFRQRRLELKQQQKRSDS